MMEEKGRYSKFCGVHCSFHMTLGRMAGTKNEARGWKLNASSGSDIDMYIYICNIYMCVNSFEI